MAYVPAIPDCHAWGQTSEKAQAELINVFEKILEESKEEGRMLPEDIDVNDVYACQS